MANDDQGQPSTFGLDEVLGALGGDLRRAQEVAGREGFGLVVREAEVELAFVVEEGKEAGGGVNLRVFGVGGGGKLSRKTSEERVHRIKVVLQPDGSGSDRSRAAVAGRRSTTQRSSQGS